MNHQPFEEEIIDLDTPRSPEYLKINPRGLVPALAYRNGNGDTTTSIITESAIVATFLADTYPDGGLLPASTSPGGALARARVAFFVDTWFTKVQGAQVKALTTGDDAAFAEVAKAVAREIEPLLEDAGPFLGGSKTLTLAEVSCPPPPPKYLPPLSLSPLPRTAPRTLKPIKRSSHF